MADSAFRINRGVTLNPQSAAPSNPTNGDFYYDSTLNTFVLYNNGFWENLTSRVDIAGATDITSTTMTATVVQNSIIRITGSTNTNLHGLSASANAKQFILYNVSTTAVVTIKYQSATEPTAANRIVTYKAGDIVLGTGQAALFAYDSAQSAWVLLSVSGTGTGDASQFTETLKNRLVASPFNLVTPYVINTQAKTLFDISNSTATYSAGDGAIEFTAASQSFLTLQMADSAEFLANTDALGQAELMVEWITGFVDPAATYSLSRNAGLEWQPITMTRVGSTDTFRGVKIWNGQYSSGSLVVGTIYVISTYNSSDDFTNVGASANQAGVTFTATGTTPTSWAAGSVLTTSGEQTNQAVSTLSTNTSTFAFNASTQQKMAQPIVLSTKTLLKQITLNLTKTGSPTGNLYVSIVNDSNPSSPTNTPSTALADILCESNAISIAGLSTGATIIDIPDIYVTAGTYHIVVRTDATYQGVFSAGVTQIAWQGNNAAGAPPYQVYFNGTSWSIQSGKAFAYTATGIAIDLRIKIVSSTGSGGTPMKVAALGVFYDFQTSGLSTSSTLQRQVFSFSGAANTTSFAITAFTPDPNLLKVYDVSTGQVYVYGSFFLDGYNVVFSSGQFLVPGQTVTLVFDQTAGGSFDSSDVNALLLASNHLGSTNGALDRSIAGMGIFLRRPDGTLREIAIDNNDNIVVYSV